MATPHKTTILANVKTTLEGITVANGYKSTVVTVEQKIKNPQDVGTSLRPWIGFRPTKEMFEAEGPHFIRVKMGLYIGAHVNATTEALVDVAITNFQDDIIAAMYSDPTFGETAVDVRLIDGQDDIGDPDRAEGGSSAGYSGTFEQNWEIEYERTTSST